MDEKGLRQLNVILTPFHLHRELYFQYLNIVFFKNLLISPYHGTYAQNNQGNIPKKEFSNVFPLNEQFLIVFS